jgi:hypothetical protein
MARNPTPKRPRTPTLTLTYDAGSAARHRGLPRTGNPFQGSADHGDEIRSSLWDDGWSDADLHLVLTDMEDLL